MLKFLILWVCVSLSTECDIEDGKDTNVSEKSTVTPAEARSTSTEAYTEANQNAIVNNIVKFEQKATAVNDAKDKLTTEETEKLYEDMVAVLDELIDTFNENPANADLFLKQQGISKVIMPHLSNLHPELRQQLLVLIRTLFEVDPKRTAVVIPITVIDKLMHIFETDENLDFKGHVVDILYLWIPGKPRVQARVMKVSGLEPFYDQLTKLDTSVIRTLLELFNKVLNEHLTVRKADKTPKSEGALKNIAKYEMIGLLEKIATPSVCNGLMQIFKTAWSQSTNDDTVMVPILELVKHTKEFCLSKFKHKDEVLDLFENFLEYIADVKTKDQLSDVGEKDLVELQHSLEEAIEQLRSWLVKEEL